MSFCFSSLKHEWNHNCRWRRVPVVLDTAYENCHWHRTWTQVFAHWNWATIHHLRIEFQCCLPYRRFFPQGVHASTLSFLTTYYHCAEYLTALKNKDESLLACTYILCAVACMLFFSLQWTLNFSWWILKVGRPFLKDQKRILVQLAAKVLFVFYQTRLKHAILTPKETYMLLVYFYWR